MRLYTQHQQLIARLNQSGLQRFRAEQLTAKNVYHIAEIALQADTTPLLKVLLEKNATLSTYPINQVLSATFIALLLPVFQTHQDYLERCWPLQLSIHEHLENKTSVGAQLFKKALQCENSRAVQLLLNARFLISRFPGLVQNQAQVCVEQLKTQLQEQEKALEEHLKEQKEHNKTQEEHIKTLQTQINTLTPLIEQLVLQAAAAGGSRPAERAAANETTSTAQQFFKP
jgi:phage shock protein A